jgi:hypothetical protein
MGLAYQIWVFFMYIVAMTLTTFWAQDIFDELLMIKLARRKQSDRQLKENLSLSS